MNKKIVDIIIVVGLLLVVGVGIITAKGMRSTASKQIEAKSDIEFVVFLRNVTVSNSICPIKSGEKTFISIRNVPYSDLDVIDVNYIPKKTVVAAKNYKGYIVVDDAALLDTYDIVVKVKDTAFITKDGAVAGGNKIKIGLPITLEGKTYKLNGTVSDITIVNNTDSFEE